ncbi:alginate export family protein [Novosphingobium sp.]|uniref:alginate export family protein n=1 Tax=Novosphingobium sp. TaxID=1874826 RepID=UPI00262202C7|nr:alginate export family protein [Novosphingobium sp.]
MSDRRNTRFSALLLAALLAGAPSAALAQSLLSATPPRVTNESLFGDNPASAKPGDDELQVNALLIYDMAILSDEDVSSSTSDQRTAIRPEARVEVLYAPDEDLQVFGAIEAGFDHDRRGTVTTNLARLELRELFVLFDDFLAKNFQLQIGRQDFEDKREWLYDSRIDGVRMAYDHRQWRVELAWVREELVRSDLLHARTRKRPDNFVFHAEYEVTRNWDLSAYAIRQADRTGRNLKPITVGLQSEGKTGAVGHWLELAMQRGKSGSRKLRSWAIDAGLTWSLPFRGTPTLIAGYARGSGGGDARIDGKFRQTGLQDNEDRISGLGNVRYYGELLDPDLSNIQIATAGIGFRPGPTSSVEVIAHRYWQSTRDDGDIAGALLTAEMDGDSRFIGTEIDVIGAIRLTPTLGLEAKLGWFKAGTGLSGANRDAFLAKFRLVKRL